jgi:sporulation protein YlmC with PRC-barrel domain
MFSRKPKIIATKLKSIEHLKSFKSYLKRRVYSKRGEYVGKVYDVLFNEKTLLGIMVKGKKNIFVGKEYISSESANAIVLKIEPITNLIGKQVFDSRGKRIGIVSDIKRRSKSNTYTDLMVKKAFYRRAFSVPKKDVEIAKKNIILKKEYE